jgi:hypothetical protein
MQTPEFRENLTALLDHAQRKRTVVMYAEPVPWRCHRYLIADPLTARGVPVRHILTATQTRLHALSAFARVTDDRITYPGVDVATETSDIDTTADAG